MSTQPNAHTPRKIQVSPNVQKAVSAALNKGHVVLLEGRWSASTGTKAIAHAVQDLFEAADALADQGVEVRHLLPSRQSLIQRLSASQDRTTALDDRGRRFNLTFLVVDLSHAGLVLLLCAGSGCKLDEENVQPFIHRVMAETQRWLPALIWSKYHHRLARDELYLMQLLLVMRSLRKAGKVDCHLGDGDHGIWENNDLMPALRLLKGAEARSQAELLAESTRKAMYDKTGPEMVGGRAPYAVNSLVPPGFGRARLRGPRGEPAGCVIFLDCDEARPRPGEALYGLPEVYVDEGAPEGERRHVDQVEIVRFVWSVVGRPGWTRARIVAEMMARGYSTERVRRQLGPAARLRGQPSSELGARALTSLLGNIDLYETGTLVRKTGGDGPPAVVRNCLPLDGRGWATPEDFARARAWLQSGKDRATSARSGTFAGLSVMLDGAPAVLRTVRPPLGRTDGRVRYSPRGVGRAGNRPSLDHDVLAAAIVESLVAAADLPLGRFRPVVAADPAAAVARGRLAEAERALEGLQAEAETLYRQIRERGADGEPLLSGSSLRRASEDFNLLDDVRIPTAREEVQELCGALERAEAGAREEVHGARVGAVLALVASLKDPYCRTFSEEWRRALTDVHVELDSTGTGLDCVTAVRLSGHLLLSDDGGAAVVPVCWAVRRPSPRPGPGPRRGGRTRGRELLRRRRDLSAEEVAAVARGYQQGVAVPLLCAEHGISAPTLYAVLDAQGVRRRSEQRRRLDEDAAQRLVQSYRAGRPVLELAGEHGLSVGSVYSLLRARRVPMRGHGRGAGWDDAERAA